MHRLSQNVLKMPLPRFAVLLDSLYAYQLEVMNQMALKVSGSDPSGKIPRIE